MRLPTSQRRAQIIDCALAALAEEPVGALSTRALAERVGISQPALFRHFPSRDAILAAVVARVREELLPLVHDSIATGGLAGVRTVVAGLFATVERIPALPRLLYHDLAANQGGQDFGRDLRQLVSMQRNLLAELVRDAGQRGEIDPDVDPQLAARLLVALIQGLMLQQRLAADPAAEQIAVASLVDFWCQGLSQLRPPALQPETVAVDPATSDPLATLDVRPILEQGRDPLEDILKVLDSLPAHGCLQLLAPFHPQPLLTLLQQRGYRTEAQDCDHAPGGPCWQILVQGPKCRLLELCDLEAPEPMEHVLRAVAALEPGQDLLAHLPREPRLLLPRLAERGLLWQVLPCPEGDTLLWVRRPLET